MDPLLLGFILGASALLLLEFIASLLVLVLLRNGLEMDARTYTGDGAD